MRLLASFLILLRDALIEVSNLAKFFDGSILLESICPPTYYDHIAFDIAALGDDAVKRGAIVGALSNAQGFSYLNSENRTNSWNLDVA